MSPVLIGIIGFVILFALIAFGIPIGLSMILIGFCGLWCFLDGSAVVVRTAYSAFETASSYHLSVLPLFLLMAHVTFASGISRDLFNLATKWLGHFRGGVAMASVVACAGFAAVSASSVASAATMGLVAIPEMRRIKYDPEMATGVVAAGGSMGVLIPPSGPFIIFGILTQTSIGRLFMAGLIPGIIEAIFYFIVIGILCMWKPSMGPRGPKHSLREKVKAFSSCGEIIGLIALILGGLMVGWFTPTEAGAVGAFGAIVFSLLRKRLNWEKFKHAVIEAMLATGFIYFILIGAFIFNFFVAMSTIPVQLADFVAGLHLHPMVIMVFVAIVYVFFGCFMDAAAIMVLTIPVFFPLAVSLGFDPIWFGVLVVMVSELGLITPPLGMNVYVIAGVVPDVPLQTIFRGIVPFLFADICRLALLFLVPATALYLPSLMMS